MAKKPTNKILRFLSSLKLTLTCLILSIALVAMGTLYQATAGVFSAQEKYFRAFFVWWHLPGSTAAIPYFPGGYTVGAVLVVSLACGFLARFRLTRKTLGLYIIHSGLLLLICGELVSGILSVETRLPLAIGQSADHTIEPKKAELAITSEDGSDVIVFPQSQIITGNKITLTDPPWTLEVKKAYRNAKILPASPHRSSLGMPLADQGIGTTVSARQLPTTHKDDEIDLLTAWVEIVAGDQSLGTWLLSYDIATPQPVTSNEKQYGLAIRPKRHALPFKIRLDAFTHKKYAGTPIPKEFSSKVSIFDGDGELDRHTMIYMNHPLRYGGRTFYQAGFGQDDTISVLQVVCNPVWPIPYLSSGLVTIGLLIQFISHLTRFRGKRK